MLLLFMVVLFSMFSDNNHCLAYRQLRESPFPRCSILSSIVKSVDSTGNEPRGPSLPLSSEELTCNERSPKEKREAVRRTKPTAARWYKERQSFLSARQKKIIRDLFPLHGLIMDYNYKIQLPDIFQHMNLSAETTDSSIILDKDEENLKRKVILDIGFGLGDSLLHFARRCDRPLCIGIEILKAGIAQALERIDSEQLTTVKVIRCDVQQVLEQNLPDNTIDEAYVLFPDPWPNASRDADRRVIRPEIVRLLARKIKTGGVLRVATDVAAYADWTIEVLRAAGCDIIEPSSLSTGSISHMSSISPDSTAPSHSSRQWRLTARAVGDPLQGPTYRGKTKYEARAVTLGHQVYDFEFTRLPNLD